MNVYAVGGWVEVPPWWEVAGRWWRWQKRGSPLVWGSKKGTEDRHHHMKSGVVAEVKKRCHCGR